MPKLKEKNKAQKKSKEPKSPTAETADRYVYYQESVQAPDEDVSFIRRVFRREFGRTATTLREDFCGTALMSCAWVKKSDKNRAFGVDLDAEPLEWGREHNVSRLKEKQAQRLELIEGNALDGGTPPVDVVAALNFSYFCFHTRAELLAYFKQAYANLDKEGLLVLDLEGGWEALDETTEEREEDNFTYIWEQEKFNPIDHRARCAIHFEFEDGSRMDHAFTYEWRIWMLPEIRDALHEAGFERVEVYWEGWDEEEGEGDGNFTLQQSAENCESWIAYVVGVKR